MWGAGGGGGGDVSGPRNHQITLAYDAQAREGGSNRS